MTTVLLCTVINSRCKYYLLFYVLKKPCYIMTWDVNDMRLCVQGIEVIVKKPLLTNMLDDN
jgi:hypothetical protein